VAESPQGGRHFGDDIVSVFHPQCFEHPFVIRFPEGAVAHPGTAEQEDLVILLRIMVFEIDRTQHGQRGAVRMAGDLDVLDFGGDRAEDAAAHRRPLIGVQEPGMHPELGVAAVVGNAGFKKGEIDLPVLEGIGAAEGDVQGVALPPEVTLHAVVVVDHL